MKKVYTKPAIYFESFSMSTNIAGDCDKIVPNPTEGACGVGGSAPGLYIFNVGIDNHPVYGCNVPNNTGDIYDGFCYYNPSEDLELFNS